MVKLRPIVVYGAGGMARELEWMIDRINRVQPTWDCLGYIVTDPSKVGPNDSRDRIIGDETWLLERPEVCVTLGIGTPKWRLVIGNRLVDKLPLERLPAIVDPTVLIDEKSSVIEPGAVVCPGTIITVNVVLERFALINRSCEIGHEARVGQGCVLNPAAIVSGGVTIGAGTLVGTGAKILQYLSIGENAQVGAGAVVTRSVPASVTVVGVPARVTKKHG